MLGRHLSTTVCQTIRQNINSKSFDERVIRLIYTKQEHLLEIVVCSLNMLIAYPQRLTNADILGQGNLNMVSEKSGKSQGILLSIICGNPVLARLTCSMK